MSPKFILSDHPNYFPYFSLAFSFYRPLLTTPPPHSFLFPRSTMISLSPFVSLLSFAISVVACLKPTLCFLIFSPCAPPFSFKSYPWLYRQFQHITTSTVLSLFRTIQYIFYNVSIYSICRPSLDSLPYLTLSSHIWILSLHLDSTSRLYTSVLHLGSASRFYTSVWHLSTTPRFYISVWHLGSTSRFYISVLHLGSTSRFGISVLHLGSTSRLGISILHLGLASRFYISVLHLIVPLSCWCSLFILTDGTFPSPHIMTVL